MKVWIHWSPLRSAGLTMFFAVFCTHGSALALTLKEVYACNDGRVRVLYENGEYGNRFSRIVITDPGIADYVTAGRFAGNCSFTDPAQDTHLEASCRLADGTLVIPGITDGSPTARFAWLNSLDWYRDGNRLYRLTVWVDRENRPDGTALRFQHMSVEGVVGMNCGPTGEGPCIDTYGPTPKETLRDWFFDDCGHK